MFLACAGQLTAQNSPRPAGEEFQPIGKFITAGPPGPTSGCPGYPGYGNFGVSGTFSIVAADPETGICGAAVASKYPAVGKVVAHARPGVGAFCTQHWHHPAWGEKALDLLAAGKLPEEALGELLRDDDRPGKRQLVARLASCGDCVNDPLKNCTHNGGF